MFREAGLQSKQGWTWFSLGDCDRGEGIFLSLSLNRCIGKQDVLRFHRGEAFGTKTSAQAVWRTRILEPQQEMED